MQLIITRAIHQTHQLVQLCERMNWQPILWPMVVIEDIPINVSSEQAVLNEADYIIFVSTNAVRAATQKLNFQALKSTVKLLAIGPATAQCLNEHGIDVFGIARPPNSEGLLTFLDTQKCKVAEKNVVLCCGENPRPLLSSKLIECGARLQSMTVYKRVLPEKYSEKVCLEKINFNEPMVTLSTSINLLENLVSSLPEKVLHVLQLNKLVVISPQMETMAKQLGFHDIVLAAGASFAAVKEALINLDHV